MTDQQPPASSRRAARATRGATDVPPDGQGPARGADAGPTDQAPPRRPRGRDRYAGLDVVLDAPSSVRAPGSVPDPGRRRLVLSPHETEAVRPPSQLPRVAPTPVAPAVAATPAGPATPDAPATPVAPTAAAASAAPAASGRRLIASGRYERPLDELPAEPPVVTRSLTVEHRPRRAAARAGRRAAGPASSSTTVMGVLNVTPDSFSDGGRYTALDAALAHAWDLVAAGADVVDVGGESTRPGAERVDPAEERRRVLPVVEALVAEGVRVSVDTLHASTAAAALEVGAEIVNDVSGGLADPDMARVMAGSDRTYVASHWRGHLDAGSSRAPWVDVAREVRDELSRRVDALVDAGVDRDRLVLDPGLGFSKVGAENWRLLAELPALVALGLPVLVGASRKRFLAELLPEGAPPEDRDPASAVVGVLAVQAGAWGVRVHDVAGTRAALDVLGAWRAGGEAPAGARRARHA